MNTTIQAIKNDHSPADCGEAFLQSCQLFDSEGYISKSSIAPVRFLVERATFNTRTYTFGCKVCSIESQVGYDCSIQVAQWNPKNTGILRQLLEESPVALSALTAIGTPRLYEDVLAPLAKRGLQSIRQAGPA